MQAFRDSAASAAGGPPGLSRTASILPVYDEARVPKLGELLEVEVAEEEGGTVDWKVCFSLISPCSLSPCSPA